MIANLLTRGLITQVVSDARHDLCVHRKCPLECSPRLDQK